MKNEFDKLNRIKITSKIIILLLIFNLVLLPVLILPSPILTVRALSGSFTEDFTTKKYKDNTSTTAGGWGTGTVSLKRNQITLVGIYNTTGNAHGIYVDGDYAYLADGTSGLQIINITDVYNPSFLGSYDTAGTAENVFVAGDCAFVVDSTLPSTDPSNLYILNVSHVENPILLANYSTTDYPEDVYVDGNLAYIANGNSGLYVLNITNPAIPSFVGSCATTGYAESVYIDGDYAYVAATNQGIKIIDITTPSSPNILGTITNADESCDLIINGDYAYVAAGLTGFQVANISNPSTPSILATNSAPSYGRGVTTDGDHVYVADEVNGISVIDVQNGSNPLSVDNYTSTGTVHDIAIDGKHAFLASDDAGLEIIEVRDIVDLDPSNRKAHLATGYTDDVTVVGDYAYICHGSKLTVIDISNPVQPFNVSSCTLPSTAREVAVAGNYAFVVSQWEGVSAVDITDPLNPVIVGTMDLSDSFTDLVIAGNYIYLAGYSLGMRVIDITDPTSMSQVAVYDSAGYVWGLDVSGDNLIIGDWQGGVVAVDVSNPLKPSYLSTWGGIGSANSVQIAGDVAYICDQGNGIVAIDIQNPNNISKLSITGGSAKDVKVAGNIVFQAPDWTAITLRNFTDTKNPINMGGVGQMPGYQKGLSLAGDYVYVASSEGFSVVKIMERKHAQYQSSQIAQSSSIATSSENAMITSAKLNPTDTQPSNTSIQYQLSADNGLHWEDITPGLEHEFIYPGQNLKWRAFLSTVNSSVTPTLNQINIDYKTIITTVPILLSPAADAIISDTTPAFNWTSLTEADSYLFQLDGPTTHLNLTLIDSNYTVLSPLEEGEWQWRVAAIDTDGDLGSFSSYRNFILDIQPPIITSSPEDLVLRYGDDSQSLDWQISETQPDNYTIYQNGTIVNATTFTNTISYPLTGLDLGQYNFTCVAQDIAGNQIQDEVWVTVIMPPTISHPVDFSIMYGEGSAYSILWTITSDYPDNYTVYQNGTIYDQGGWVDSVSVWLDGISELEGYHNFTCVVQDIVGNLATDEVWVTVLPATPDTTSPTISHPTDIEFEEGSLGYHVVWSGNDDRSPWWAKVWRDYTLIYDQAWIGNNISVSLDGLAVGVYAFNCTLYDAAGNAVNDLVWVTVTEQVPDTDPPTLIAPEPLTYHEGDTGNTAMWICYDEHPYAYQVLINLSEHIYSPWHGENISVNVDGLPEGEWNIKLIVWDLARNNATSTVSVTVNPTIPDTTPPSLSQPADILVGENMTGLITWEVSDENPGKYILLRNNTVIYQQELWQIGIIQYHFEPLPVGTWVFNLTVWDEAGNHASSQVIVNVLTGSEFDITPPQISQHADMELKYGTTGNYLVFYIFDQHPASYDIYFDDILIVETRWITPNKQVNISLDGLEIGSYVINITCWDLYAQWSSESVVVTVIGDNSPPTIVQVPDLELHQGDAINITWECSDEYPSHYKIILLPSEDILESGNWDGSSIHINLEEYSVGTYIFQCIVYDIEGNSAFDTVQVIIKEAKTQSSPTFTIFVTILGMIGLTYYRLRKRRLTQ